MTLSLLPGHAFAGDHSHTPAAPAAENEIPAACTADGSYDSVVYCSECGEELSRESVTVSALGHDFWVVESRAPRCILDGFNTYCCSRCPAEDFELIPPLGHYFISDWIVETAPTCTEPGIAHIQCYRCNSLYQELQALGQDFIGDLSSNDDGTHSRSCIRCTATECEACSFESMDTPPTLFEPGYTTYICTVCRYSYSDSYTDPIPECTVSFSVLGDTSVFPPATATAEAPVTLPAAEGPAGYDFLGWVTEDYYFTAVMPENILTGSYAAEADITLRALFCFTARGERYTMVNGLVAHPYPDPFTGELFYVISDTPDPSIIPYYDVYLKAADLDAVYAAVQAGHTRGVEIFRRLSSGEIVPEGGNYSYRVRSLTRETAEWSCYTTFLHTHSFGDWSSNDDGTHSRSCSLCGFCETEACSFESVVTPPTETEEGYTTHTCTVCGYSYVDSYTAPIGEAFTVSFSVLGDTSVIPPVIAAADTPITLPVAEGPAGYAFLGWVTEDYDFVETLPENILTGSYSAEADITLKALFRTADEVDRYTIINDKIARPYPDPFTGELFYVISDTPDPSSIPYYDVYLKAADLDAAYDRIQAGIFWGTPYYERLPSGEIVPVMSAYAYLIRTLVRESVACTYYTTLPADNPAEPILDLNIRIFPSISIGIDLVNYFSVPGSDLSEYSSWYLEISKLDAAGNPYETKRFGEGQEGEIQYGAVCRAVYEDITAKELGVRFVATVHAFDANGQEYYSDNLITSTPVQTVRDYVIGELANEDNPDATRKLAADLLNYGAAAQVYFDFDTENLVNENLSTEAQAAMDEFATTGEAPAVLVNNANSANIFTSVSVMNRVVLTLSIRGFSSAGAVQIEIKDHNSGVVKELIDAEKVNTIWRAKYSAFEAEDMRTAFDFTVIADGSASGTPITWSVEGYAREARLNEDATAEELALLNALLHYVDAAAAADFGS